MTALTPHTVRAMGTILTAVIYNADHINHYLNALALDNNFGNFYTKAEANAQFQPIAESGSIFRRRMVLGVDGEQGEQGPPGPKGSRGVPGPAGPTGPTGLTGPRGRAVVVSPIEGAEGAQGFPGPRGSRGQVGAPGPTGATGPASSKSFIVAASDETTALTTGTAKVTFRMPFAMTLTAVRATLSTTQTSGNILTIDINEAGSTILSTKLTIDNGEETSTTAATPAVISDSALADDAEITIDIDQVGDGTAKGLKVVLIGT